MALAAALALSLPAGAKAESVRPAPVEVDPAAAPHGAHVAALTAATHAAEDEAWHRRLDVARDHLLDHDLDAADGALGPLLETPMGSGPAARARVLAARIALERGLGVRALGHLEGVAPASVDAPDHLRWLTARAAVMAGQPERAVALYDEILTSAPRSRVLHYARAGRADALFAAGRFEEAQAAYADVLQRYPRYPQAHIAMFQRAQALLRLGRDDEGARLMQRVWLEFPWKEEGVKARLVLDASRLLGFGPVEPATSKLLERGRELRQMKHWGAAERELGDLLVRAEREGAPRALLNGARMELALVAYDMQDYDRALPMLEDMARRATTPGQADGLNADFVHLTLQRSLKRAGRVEEAEALLKRRMARRPVGVRNRELAEFYWDVGRYKEAHKLFETVYRKRDRQGWDYAFLLYKAGQLQSADQQLSALLSDRAMRGNIPYEQVLYWLARTRERRGMVASARTLYKNLHQSHPWNYYGHQARSRLIDLERAGAAAQAGDEAAAAAPELEARVYWSGPDAPPEPDLESLAGQGRLTPYVTDLPLQGGLRRAAALHGDLWPKLKVASWLHDAGEPFEAQWEMRQATQEYIGLRYAMGRGARPTPQRPIALTRHQLWDHYVDRRRQGPKGFWGLATDKDLYPVPRDAAGRLRLYQHQEGVRQRLDVLKDDMRLAMMEVGDHHFARRLRLGTAGWSGTDPGDEAHRQAWTELHPRAYARLVTRYAGEVGLNPYILWAVMTVESAYNPDTVSHADARGLLQVIPKTGNKVAAAMGEDHFGQYDLLDPDTSIRHGAWYFAQLMDKYQHQEPLAIASYNGGPHNVQKWFIHKRTQPLDEFVEEIPFDEARRYTKRVLHYLGMFLRIYEGSEGLYIGSRFNPDFKPDPRY